MEEQKELYYGNILDQEDIKKIGYQIHRFENGAIEFDEMQQELRKQGIEIEPRFLDAAEYFKGRNNSQQYIDNFKAKIEKGIVSRYDVTGYYISCHQPEQKKSYEHLPISYDRLMLEELASMGISEAVECLSNLQREEEREASMRF